MSTVERRLPSSGVAWLQDSQHASTILGLKRVLRQPGASWGLVIICIVVACALAAPLLAPYPPNQIALDAQLEPPGPGHLLGTDFYGRDMLSRLIYGARATLGVAAFAVLVATIFGTLLGLVAGASRGWFGQFWVAVIDVLLAFPTLILALLMIALLGPGLPQVAIAVGIASIPIYARVVRSFVLTERASLYVEAARALGAGHVRILLQHLFPGALAPVAALTTLDAGRAILSVAALGFLGMGAPPPQAEWGLMLYEGRLHLISAPWVSFEPGLAIAITVLAITLLGDALVTPP